jgi:hypothetical protein
MVRWQDLRAYDVDDKRWVGAFQTQGHLVEFRRWNALHGVILVDVKTSTPENIVAPPTREDPDWDGFAEED